MKKKIRILLGDKEFRLLVFGKVIQIKHSSGHTVEIALSDIGFDRMRKHVGDAKSGFPI